MQYDKSELQTADEVLTTLSIIFSVLTLLMLSATGVTAGLLFNLFGLMTAAMTVGAPGVVFLPVFSEFNPLRQCDSADREWSIFYLSRRLIQKLFIPLMALALGITLILLFSNPVTTGLAIGLLACAGLYLAISIAHLYVEKQLYDPNSDTNKPPAVEVKSPKKDNVFTEFYHKSQEFFLRFGKSAPAGVSLNGEEPGLKNRKGNCF